MKTIEHAERCVCGSEIKLSTNYDMFVPGPFEDALERWQKKHENCLPLFHEVQKIRLTQLKLTTEQKLIGGGR